MKIQCDVCNREEASIFCSADEAALCISCDRKVHRANKLAEKHTRFSLLLPSLKDEPLCDICQKRRAFVFCQEDRAILCKECEISIHNANENTQKHNRFLLSGVKLSAFSSLYPTATTGSSSNNNGKNATTITKKSENKPSKSMTKKQSISPVNSEIFNPQRCSNANDYHLSDTSSVSTSSISEYLETLPGWHVEDLLDASPNSFGLCKLMDQDVDSSGSKSYFSSKAAWVPQFSPSSPQLDFINGFNEEGNNKKFTQKKFAHGCLSVPQINHPYVKRCRHI